jgi:hypothetical protein
MAMLWKIQKQDFQQHCHHYDYLKTINFLVLKQIQNFTQKIALRSHDLSHLNKYPHNRDIY